MTHEEKVAALKRYLAESSDASEYCKRLVIWLIETTDGLTSAVKCSVPIAAIGFNRTQEVRYGIHDMNSDNGTTRLPHQRELLGLPFRIDAIQMSQEILMIVVRADDACYKFDDAIEVTFDPSAIGAIDLENYC